MYSIEQSPRMNLSLRSNQSESVRAAVENVEPDTNKPEDYAFDEPTKIFFVPKHVSTNFSKPSTGMRFDLGDTEQLKVFYTTRLELISKSVLERITSCWHKRKRLRCISTLGEEKESRASLRKLTKDGKYHKSAIFIAIHSTPFSHHITSRESFATRRSYGT
jgi:hypothetical protein